MKNSTDLQEAKQLMTQIKDVSSNQQIKSLQAMQVTTTEAFNE